MAYLLDTNVISGLRKSAPNAHVLTWHQSQTTAEAYVSTLAVGEIRQGIERVRPRDGKEAEALERWLVGLLNHYRDRILPVTVDIAQEWAVSTRLVSHCRRSMA